MCDGNIRQLDGLSSVLRRRRVGGTEGRRIKPRHVPNVCMHAVSLPFSIPPALASFPPFSSLLSYARSGASAEEDCLPSLRPQLHKDAQGCLGFFL